MSNVLKDIGNTLSDGVKSYTTDVKGLYQQAIDDYEKGHVVSAFGGFLATGADALLLNAPIAIGNAMADSKDGSVSNDIYKNGVAASDSISAYEDAAVTADGAIGKVSGYGAAVVDSLTAGGVTRITDKIYDDLDSDLVETELNVADKWNDGDVKNDGKALINSTAAVAVEAGQQLVNHTYLGYLFGKVKATDIGSNVVAGGYEVIDKIKDTISDEVYESYSERGKSFTNIVAEVQADGQKIVDEYVTQNTVANKSYTAENKPTRGSEIDIVTDTENQDVELES